MKRVEELVGNLCGTTDHPLAPVLRGWMGASRAFLVFAEANATKIRKKTRLAALDEDRADLMAELAIAAFLLRDRRFEVVYEPSPPGAGRRGPDFRVVFRTRVAFHVEVTRLRLPESSDEEGAGAALKLARVLCDKIEQFPPGVPNVLAVVLPDRANHESLVSSALRLVEDATHPRERADDADVGLGGAKTFVRHRGRLSGVALVSLTVDGVPSKVTVQLERQAKHPLPSDVASYLLRTP